MATLRPVHWSATSGHAHLALEFRSDSAFGGTSTPRGSTHDVAGDSARNARERRDARDCSAPAAAHDGVGGFDRRCCRSSVGGATRVLPTRLAVIGEDRVRVPAGTFDCWVVAVHADQTKGLYWVTKTRSDRGAEHAGPPTMGGAQVVERAGEDREYESDSDSARSQARLAAGRARSHRDAISAQKRNDVARCSMTHVPRRGLTWPHVSGQAGNSASWGSGSRSGGSGGRDGVWFSAGSGAGIGTSIWWSSGKGRWRSSRSRRGAGAEFGDPVEAVNWSKQTRVRSAPPRSGSTGTAARTSPIASTSSACSWRATGCESATSPNAFSLRRFGLNSGSRFRILFGYRVARFSGTITLHGQSGLRLTERMREMAVSTLQDDKKKALNLAIAQIEKSCGKGSIMRLGADQKVRVEAISDGRDQSRCGDRRGWHSARSRHRDLRPGVERQDDAVFARRRERAAGRRRRGVHRRRARARYRLRAESWAWTSRRC